MVLGSTEDPLSCCREPSCIFMWWSAKRGSMFSYKGTDPITDGAFLMTLILLVPKGLTAVSLYCEVDFSIRFCGGHKHCSPYYQGSKVASLLNAE